MKPNKQPVYTGAGARRSRLLAQDRRADPLSAMSACGPKLTLRSRRGEVVLTVHGGGKWRGVGTVSKRGRRLDCLS
jgi:hypothetical protein